MENLDFVRTACIQNAVPRSLILFAQLVNTGAYLANDFPVWRSLPTLQPVQSVSEIPLMLSGKARKAPFESP